jgi:acyl-CoA dehydrogenase
MRRTIFNDEHEQFRSMVRNYLEREVVPVYPLWEEAGVVPKEFFKHFGDTGVMGMNMPEEFGGGGQSDYTYNVVLQEETARLCVTLGPLRTHLDVILPYFRKYANPEQQSRWFPRISTGELLTAIAMSEPDAGSDLAGVRTSAERDGDDYIVNGSKTFITGGLLADLVIVLARTHTNPNNRRDGLSLIVVEDGTSGFEKGRKLKKLGLSTQDTAELSFNDVRVPVANRLGEENEAFSYLAHNLPQERLAIAVGSVAQSRSALNLALEYVRNRVVFGKPVSDFQNTKFELASVVADVEAAEATLDRAVIELVKGDLDPVDAAKVKLFCTEIQGRIVDRCLQLFGGYGYMSEYPISRLYADARVSRIYGGTSEVMKLIISKSLNL